MKTIVLSGTPRKNGNTRVVARFVREKLYAILVDLSTIRLPLFNGEDSQGDIQEVRWIRQQVEQADRMVWISPEYHNGVSGSLKNALEFMGAKYFKGKPTLLLSVSGGGKGGINSLNQMRTIARSLQAYTLPSQMVFDPDAFHEGHGLHDEAQEKLEIMLQELQNTY